MREPIGYVCANCGWWIPTLSTWDEHCDHLVVALPEDLPPAAVERAKLRTANKTILKETK